MFQQDEEDGVFGMRTPQEKNESFAIRARTGHLKIRIQMKQ
jgi:hypothetical protein